LLPEGSICHDSTQPKLSASLTQSGVLKRSQRVRAIGGLDLRLRGTQRSRRIGTLSSQSILPVHCGCPHSQEISAPVLTVSQWGLQYLLSLAAKQLQPVCPHRFLFLSSISNPFYLDFLPSPFDLIEHLLYIGLQVTETLFTFVSEGGRDLSPGAGSFEGLCLPGPKPHTHYSRFKRSAPPTQSEVLGRSPRIPARGESIHWQRGTQ
jgi:hypothetical protein